MTTVTLDTLVSRVRKLTLDEPYEDYTTAAVSDTTGTSISVNSGASWAEGDIVEFRDSSYEQMKVRVGGASPLTVKRGHNDTTAATHTSGVTILKNPRFTADEINEALTRMCYASWPQAWQVKTDSISTPTLTSSTLTYNAPADIIDLVSVTQQEDSTADVNDFYYGTVGYPIAVEHNVSTAVASNTRAYRFGILRNATKTINIRYRTYLDTSSITEGLMADCLVMGAVARILGMRQVQRSGIDLRQAEPGLASAYLQDAAYFQSEYQRLLRLLHLQLLADPTTAPMQTWRPTAGGW